MGGAVRAIFLILNPFWTKHFGHFLIIFGIIFDQLFDKFLDHFWSPFWNPRWHQIGQKTCIFKNIKKPTVFYSFLDQEASQKNLKRPKKAPKTNPKISKTPNKRFKN